MINNDFDIAYYENNKNLISIKQLSKDIDICDSVWDGLFNFILFHTNTYLFSGFKLNIKDQELPRLLDWLSASEIKDQKTSSVLLEIRPGNIELNRGLLSKVWAYYEFPCLVFLDDEKKKDKVKSLFRDKRKVRHICQAVNGLFVVYKSFEEDVLWIEKSIDMPAVRIG